MHCSKHDYLCGRLKQQVVCLYRQHIMKLGLRYLEFLSVAPEQA